MVRFQCIHCGERIAVPDGNMDRLARCPECGGVTHPLAEHIAAPESAPGGKTAKGSSDKAKVDADAPVCDNCGGPLGKLQKPFEWDGHFVCGPCHRMLSLDQSSPFIEPTTAIVVSEGDSAKSTLAPTVQSVFGDIRKVRTHPTEFALMVRTICVGLCIVAVALYVIVSILQSLGYIIMWGAIAVVVLAAIYWIRKGILAIRKRGGTSRAGNATL